MVLYLIKAATTKQTGFLSSSYWSSKSSQSNTYSGITYSSNMLRSIKIRLNKAIEFDF
jgi:hypothetical protein